jgi:hypothetical protein
VDLATQSAVKKLALATNMIQPLTMKNTAEGSNAMVAAMAAGCTTPGATTCFTDEDFLAHAGVLLASSAHYSSKFCGSPTSPPPFKFQPRHPYLTHWLFFFLFF